MESPERNAAVTGIGQSDIGRRLDRDEAGSNEACEVHLDGLHAVGSARGNHVAQLA